MSDPLCKRATRYTFSCLPEIVEGRVNATRRRDDQGTRSLVEARRLGRPQFGRNPRPIDTERWNARLIALPSHESPKGFKSIPIMKLRRSANAEGQAGTRHRLLPPAPWVRCSVAAQGFILASICAQLGALFQIAGGIHYQDPWGLRPKPIEPPKCRRKALLIVGHQRGLSLSSATHRGKRLASFSRIHGAIVGSSANWRSFDPIGSPPISLSMIMTTFRHIFRIVRVQT